MFILFLIMLVTLSSGGFKDVSGKGCRSCDPSAYIFWRNPTRIWVTSG